MKKIRINLYSDEFHPKSKFLNLKHILFIWGIVFVLVCCGIFNSWYKMSVYKKENYSIEKQLKEKKHLLTDVKKHIAEQELDTVLQKEVDDLKILVESKEKMSELLSGNKILKSNGYAVFMESMAKIGNHRVAVSSFNLEDTKADIIGKAIDSQDVPQWIADFKKYDDLNVITFGELSINRNNTDGLIDFSLKSMKEIPVNNQQTSGNKDNKKGGGK